MEKHDRYAHILSAVYGSAWAIMPDKFKAICDVLDMRLSGIRLSAEEIEAKVGRPPMLPAVTGNIAVMNMFGIVSQRANMMSDISGGTSTELFGAMFDKAMRDDTIGAIVFNVDSPGGSVFGVQELADKIFSARGKKPVVAVANSLAASAAYWIASAADQFAVTPSGEIGSVGVFAVHRDFSAQNEMIGVKPTYISAGKYKVEGNPDAPLGDEALASLQGTVNRHYDTFTAAVARHRNVKQSEVTGGFGEGRTVGAKEAVTLGMADRVDTLEGVLEELTRKHAAKPRRSLAAMKKRLELTA